MTTFREFPKIPRLNRDIVVTEKIDGTNAAVVIVPWAQIVEEVSEGWNWTEEYARRYHSQRQNLLTVVGEPVSRRLSLDGGTWWVEYRQGAFAVFAQSRKRFITPTQDNYGFAKWVQDNAETLVEDLGEGYHYGEWWGSGIQRGYEMPKGHRRFSLFNTSRWAEVEFGTPFLDVVPMLYEGPFDTHAIRSELDSLRKFGSKARPGYMNAEGVIVFHKAGNLLFKATVKNDEKPKGMAA